MRCVGAGVDRAVRNQNYARSPLYLGSFSRWYAYRDPQAVRSDNHIGVTGQQFNQEIVVKASPKLYSLDWSSDGQGLFVSALVNGGSSLLHLDLQGNAQTLWYSKGGIREPGDLFFSGTLAPRAVPSPDGRHLAIQSQSVSSNVWMIEKF